MCDLANGFYPLKLLCEALTRKGERIEKISFFKLWPAVWKKKREGISCSIYARKRPFVIERFLSYTNPPAVRGLYLVLNLVYVSDVYWVATALGLSRWWDASFQIYKTVFLFVVLDEEIIFSSFHYWIWILFSSFKISSLDICVCDDSHC